MIKRTILLTAVLLSFTLLHAQQRLSYAYDAAGNRTERTIVLGTRSTVEPSDTVAAAPSAKEESPSSAFFDESLGTRKIRIHPNPVEFELNVSLLDYEPAMKGEYSLFNIMGAMLIKRPITGADTRIDMSRYPRGMYLLHIRLKDTTTAWKIIKR